MDYPSMITEAQLEAMAPFFPTPRRPREDDRRTSGGVIIVIRFGLPWRAAPPEYGPHKTICTRWKRWSKAGIFCHILQVLADQKAETHTLMMDSTFCKTGRHACSRGFKYVPPEPGSNWTWGGVNSRLHRLCDAGGRLMRLHLTAGQKSDIEGARVLPADLPPAKVPVADSAHDANDFRNKLKRRKLRRCIPPWHHRKKATRHDRNICKSRHRIEISFGRLKDWNRVAFRRDRCPEIFLSACAQTAICIFRL